MKSTYHPFFQNFGSLSKAVRSLEKVVEFNTFVDVKQILLNWKCCFIINRKPKKEISPSINHTH